MSAGSSYDARDSRRPLHAQVGKSMRCPTNQGSESRFPYVEIRGAEELAII